MRIKHLTDLGEDIPELVCRGFIPQAEGMVKPDLIAHREVLEAHHCELAVRNRNGGSLEGPESGRAQADILNGTEVVSCPAEVPHADGLIRDDHDPAEEIFQCFLCGKG